MACVRHATTTVHSLCTGLWIFSDVRPSQGSDQRPVLDVESLVLRPIDHTPGAGDTPPDALFHVAWFPLTGAVQEPAGTWVMLGDAGPGLPDLPRCPDLAAATAHSPDVLVVPSPDLPVRELAAWGLELVRSVLADERLAAARLVVVTRDAVHAPRPDRVPTRR